MAWSKTHSKQQELLVELLTGGGSLQDDLSQAWISRAAFERGYRFIKKRFRQSEKGLERLLHGKTPTEPPRVKNDDKITGETLSQTVSGNTQGKALQHIEISSKTKGYRHSS
jgi:hypothetical protein